MVGGTCSTHNICLLLLLLFLYLSIRKFVIYRLDVMAKICRIYNNYFGVDSYSSPTNKIRWKNLDFYVESNVLFNCLCRISIPVLQYCDTIRFNITKLIYTNIVHIHAMYHYTVSNMLYGIFLCKKQMRIGCAGLYRLCIVKFTLNSIAEVQHTGYRMYFPSFRIYIVCRIFVDRRIISDSIFLVHTTISPLFPFSYFFLFSPFDLMYTHRSKRKIAESNTHNGQYTTVKA